MNRTQEIVKFVSEKTGQVACFEVLTLTGSALNKELVENIDFLLLSDQKVTAESIIKVIDINLLSRYKDCYVFNFKEISVNITVMELERFNKYYENIYYGKNIELSYSNWCLGYFIPEAFLGDIKNSKVIFEKINFSAKYKDSLNIYPLPLRQSIIETSVWDLEIKKNLFYKSLEKNNSIAVLASVSEILFISFRALFAKEGLYYRGLFSLDSYLLSNPELNLFLKPIIGNILNVELLKESVDNYLKTVNQILIEHV